MDTRALSVRRLGEVFLAIALAAVLAAPVSAQSLNIKAPTPLVAGDNRGTVDNMVGAQYWSFKYGAGKATIVVRFTSMGLFGNPRPGTINIVLHAADGKVFGTRSLTSSGKVAEDDWPGTFSSPGIAIVEIRSTDSNLVRNGGDYTIKIVGDAVNFAGARAAGPEQIVGTYAVMVCPPDFDCQGSLAARFMPDGTVATTDGHKGTWKIFDPGAMVYAVAIGKDRWSMKLVPGRGLFNTSDLSVVVFQSVRPN
jgi:hypothetical protein